MGKPVGDRHLGDDDGRRLTVAVIQNFQDALSVGGDEFVAQTIIENEQVGACPGAQEASQPLSRFAPTAFACVGR